MCWRSSKSIRKSAVVPTGMSGRWQTSGPRRWKPSRKILMLLITLQMPRELTEKSCSSWNCPTPTSSSSKRSSGRRIIEIFTWYSNIWISTCTPSFVKIYLHRGTANSSSIRWPKRCTTCIRLASFTETWSHQTSWLMKIATLNFVISGWFALSMMGRRIQMITSQNISQPDGTEPQKYS